MTINDIYNSPMQTQTNDLYSLVDIIEEINLYDLPPYDYDDDNSNQQEIIIKTHLYDGDGYRGIEISSIWFNNEPVMLIMKAGRDLKESKKFFITNENLYKDMIKYLQGLIFINMFNTIDIYDKDKHIEDIEEFYGYKLYEKLENINVVPKFKEGDNIIITELKENINFDNTDENNENILYKNVKGKITKVNSKSYYNTYEVMIEGFKYYPFKTKEGQLEFKIVPKEEQYTVYNGKIVPDDLFNGIILGIDDEKELILLN